MFTITELSRAIHTMVANKQSAEALDFFKLHKNEVEAGQISRNEFLIADLLTALRGIKAFDAAWQFLNIYKITVDATTPVRILNSYGWLLYFQYKAGVKITNSSVNTESFTEILPVSEQIKAEELKTGALEVRIEKLMDILKNTNDTYSTNLAEYLFKLIMHTQKTQPSTNWKYIERVCSHTDPLKLSTSCANIQVERKGQQKDMELASAREEWYAMYSKALYEAGNYKKCTEMCQLALQQIDKMHYANEIWFERRKALCLTKTNQYKAAIEIYLQLIPRKKDWFILKELCECYFKIGENDKALQHGRKAACALGPINFKVELIELVGDILRKQNENALANKHYRLAKVIRDAEKWKIDKVLVEKITTTSILSDKKPDNKETLKAELIDFWNEGVKPVTKQTTITKPGEKITGTITKLLPTKEAGADGFVKSDKGNSTYFFIPKNDTLFNQLKVGLRVQYHLQPAPKGDKAIKMTML
ncbi:MAG: hypothetical protein Q7U47_11345 [Paludibacter sp.]|nr:hypothetical protein [Paludibacter sp.]